MDNQVLELLGHKWEFLSKDNNWADGTTVYWFTKDHTEVFGVVHSSNDEPVVVDCDGFPLLDDELMLDSRQGLIESVTDELIQY